MTPCAANGSLQHSACRILSLVLVLFAASTLLAQSGATYYVATNGSDGNPGTFAAPWLSWRKRPTRHLSINKGGTRSSRVGRRRPRSS